MKLPRNRLPINQIDSTANFQLLILYTIIAYYIATIRVEPQALVIQAPTKHRNHPSRTVFPEIGFISEGEMFEVRFALKKLFNVIASEVITCLPCLILKIISLTSFFLPVACLQSW